MKNPVLHFLFFVLLSCNALGGEKGKHTCRVIFLERPAAALRTMHLFDGTTWREVDLPSMNLSKVYELPKGEILLSLLPAPPAKPENLPSGAPTAIQLPLGAPTAIVSESATDIYLLVMSDPTNKLAGVRLKVVDASDAKLQRGQTLWFNLTEHLVGGQLGSEKIVMKPGSRTVMAAPRADAGDYPVSFAYRMEGKEHSYPICETRWNHDPAARNLGFVISKLSARTPRVFVFPDFREETSIAAKEDN